MGANGTVSQMLKPYRGKVAEENDWFVNCWLSIGDGERDLSDLEVEIVRNNQAEPLECAVPSDKKDFISAYDDGTINIRSFSRPGNGRTIRTIPGIDADVFRWRTVKSDPELRVMLSGYTH